jgi:hypothetical protein
MHGPPNVKYVLHLVTSTNTVLPEDRTKEKKNVGESNKFVYDNFTLLCVLHWFCNHYNHISVVGTRNIKWHIF